MQARRSTFIAIFCLCSTVFASDIGRAEVPTSKVYGDTLDKQTHTAYIRADVGWETYESGAVTNNATGLANTVEVGGAAGSSRTLGIAFQSSQSEIPFSVGSSAIYSAFNDVKVRMRVGNFFPTGVGSMTRVKISDNRAAVNDVYGSGGGGGLGLRVPITREILFEGEGILVRSIESHDKLGAQGGIGDRVEAAGEVAFDLTADLIDLVVGHRYRRYSLRIDDRDTDEVQSSPFVGLRMGVYF